MGVNGTCQLFVTKKDKKRHRGVDNSTGRDYIINMDRANKGSKTMKTATITKLANGKISVAQGTLFEVLDSDGNRDSGDLLSCDPAIRAAIDATVGDGNTRTIGGESVSSDAELDDCDRGYDAIDKAMTLGGCTY